MSARWPTGRYNGQRIAGLKVSVALNLLSWYWLPVARWSFGNPYFIWLCFAVRGEAVYER